MSTAVESALVPNTRRWPRYQANLPVLISAGSNSAVPGLASEISRSGMALYGGVCLKPGDLMRVEFQTSGKLLVAGVVRSRSGFCFGLEFLNPLATDDEQNLAAYALPLPEEALRDWVAKHRGDVSLAMASVLLFLTLFAWHKRPDPSTIARAQISAPPALTIWERTLVGLGLAEIPEAPVPRGDPAVQVWVDQHTALYYCPGAELYGKTPDGRFTTQRDAQLDQFEPAARAYCP